MKTPLPRLLTPRQWRRLVKLYRARRAARFVRVLRGGRPQEVAILMRPAAAAWEAAKATLFPLNFP
jgi:hypothetical protein